MAKRVPVKDPAGLSEEAQQFYRDTRKELGLSEAAALSLLLSAARSLDRLRQAEAVLASVIACLKEERASRAWESSNHDRTWWKAYPHSQTPVALACTCSALSVPHHHAESGPDANVEFGPGEDLWSVLALIVRAQGSA